MNDNEQEPVNLTIERTTIINEQIMDLERRDMELSKRVTRLERELGHGDSILDDPQRLFKILAIASLVSIFLPYIFEGIGKLCSQFSHSSLE